MVAKSLFHIFDFLQNDMARQNSVCGVFSHENFQNSIVPQYMLVWSSKKKMF